MKTSNILKAAKKHLAKNRRDIDNGKTRYVCVAIHSASSKQLTVKRRIDEALGKTENVSSWLYRNGHATGEQAGDINLMQAYRHRWLDALIDEYQKAGD